MWHWAQNTSLQTIKRLRLPIFCIEHEYPITRILILYREHPLFGRKPSTFTLNLIRWRSQLTLSVRHILTNYHSFTLRFMGNLESSIRLTWYVFGLWEEARGHISTSEKWGSANNLPFQTGVILRGQIYIFFPLCCLAESCHSQIPSSIIEAIPLLLAFHELQTHLFVQYDLASSHQCQHFSSRETS